MSNLCRSCLNLATGRSEQAPTSRAKPTPWKEWIHHKEGGISLRQGSEAGCRLCKLIWGSLSEDEKVDISLYHSNPSKFPGFDAADFAARYGFVPSLEFGPPSMLFMRWGCHVARRATIADGSAYLSYGDRVERMISILPPNRVSFSMPEKLVKSCPEEQLWSETSKTLLKEWVNQCRHNHPICSRQSRVGKYPSRLIYVGDGRSALPRLCETSELAQRKPYMTLSHCWGQAKIFTLSTANLGRLKRSISLKELPKTFQDALQITRDIGVDYLWIDSLCIMQDSIEDWKKESATMGDVYSNSFCNIAATAAVDGAGGCFRKRDAGHAQPLLIKLRNFGAQTQTDLPDGEYDFQYANLWRDEVTNSPLCQRAWVLQERVLAPRTVHFGRGQLFFECYQYQACETYPQGLPASLIPHDESKSEFSAAAWAELPNWQDREAVLGRIWRTMVVAYAKGQLTYGRDKLVAISGLAARLQEHISCDYFAGLWDGGMLNDLLWHVETKEPKPRPQQYQAPTWSWASVNSPVDFISLIDPSDTLRATVLETKVHAEKPFGQVTDGWLKMRSLLIPAHKVMTYKQNTTFEHILWYGLTLTNFDMHFDAIFDTPKEHISLTGTLFCVPVLAVGDEDVADALDDPSALAADEEDDVPRQAVGLVLEPTGNANGQFRRVGLWEMTRNQWRKQMAYHICIDGEEVDEKYFEDFDEDSIFGHTFTIV